jgi:predicted sulfurtransferase
MSSIAVSSPSVVVATDNCCDDEMSEECQNKNGSSSSSLSSRGECSSSSSNGNSSDASALHQTVVENDYCVLAFYQFFARTEIIKDDDDASNLEDTLLQIEREWKDDMESGLRSYHTYGMIRISIQEGMNGTICFPTQHLDNIRSFLHHQEQLLCERQRRNGRYEPGDTDTTESSLSSSPFKIRISYYTSPPFHRLSVRIKKEIVTMGPIPQHWISEIDDQNDYVIDDNGHVANTTPTCFVRPYHCPLRHNPTVPVHPTGIYVPPGPEWDELLYDPQCLVIDTRNEYEIQMGTFHNAISPRINEFTEFPTWLHETLQQQQPQYNKIAMFCTGGIRCEKATALCIQMLRKTSLSLSSLILDNNSNENEDHEAIAIPSVYHLEGGILAYLESDPSPSSATIESIATSIASVSDQPNADHGNSTNENETAIIRAPSYGNNFIGECFVFDQRVAVTYGLQPTQQYISCHACRRPVHIDMTSSNSNEKYQKGICCPGCYDEHEHGTKDNKKQRRYMERQKQMDLAAQPLSVKPHLYDSKYSKR